MSDRALRRPAPHGSSLVVVGLLVLLVVVAWVAGSTAPRRDYVTGLWPIGLAVGAVVLAPVRWRVPVSLAVGAIVVVAVVAGGFEVDLAVAFGVVGAIEAWVSARILQRPDGLRPCLRTDDDLRRYLLAAVAGGLVAAVGAATATLVLDVGNPGLAALGVGAAHFASQLYLAPLFLRLPEQGAIARSGERLTQGAVLVVGTPLLLVPDAAPSLVFLVIPILAWGALRIPPRESVLQMLAVLGLAVVLTSHGDGPFADLPSRYGLPGDFRGILLSAFCATCAVIVVPLILRMGEYVGAARAAAAERDLVRGIVDGATGTAIIGTDPEGLITLFNPGAERLTGYRADEVIGRRTTMLHTAEAVRDKAAELGVADDFGAVTAAVMERRLVGTRMRVRRKDGVERTHATTLSRLTVNGVTSGFISTSEDVTDQLDIEQALRDALTTEQRAVERMREVDVVKDRFVSTVSHELRTPITSILGYLEMLADGTLGDLDRRQLDALVRVQSNSKRLLSLIDDLLTLSRVAEDGLNNREGFDLRDAVRTAYDVVAPSWAAPRWLDVTLALPSTPSPLHGSADMIERLVVNLLSNAVKFTDDGGAVTVSLIVEAATSTAVLRVADTGIGIPEDEQDRMFDRFFRSSLAERRAIQGSGLGLSISRAIVHHHGGVIGVHSRPGVGTTIDVRLPLATGMSKIQLPLEQVT